MIKKTHLLKTRQILWKHFIRIPKEMKSENSLPEVNYTQNIVNRMRMTDSNNNNNIEIAQ